MARNMNLLTLLKAAEKGKLARVQELLKGGADVNEGCFGWTPLRNACHNGHLEIVRCLVEKGADVHAKNTIRWTPLHNACHRGRLEISRFLVEKGADVHARDTCGWTPLHFGCSRGHLEISRFLVEKGADVHATNINGWTPLHQACCYGHLEVVKWLVEQGANVHATNKDGKTPSDLIKSDDKSGRQIREFLVKWLESNNASMATQCSTPPPNKRRKIASPVTDLGSTTTALVNSSPASDDQSNTNNSEGNAPTSAPIFPDAVLSDQDERKFLLHCAVKYGDLDVVKDVLLQDCVGDADKNAMDSNGRAAIDLAALTGQLDVLKHLAENGCKHEKEPKPKMIAICKKRQPLANKYLEQVIESL